jgi:hypothetical protein
MTFNRTGGGEKFFPAKIARNPLKRLISDERIQGNPSFGGTTPSVAAPKCLFSGKTGGVLWENRRARARVTYTAVWRRVAINTCDES